MTRSRAAAAVACLAASLAVVVLAGFTSSSIAGRPGRAARCASARSTATTR